MAKFKLLADAEFEADDLDDAFLELARHFSVLSEGEDSHLILDGTLEITNIIEE